MNDNNNELLTELTIQQAVSSEVSGQLKSTGTAYILFFVTIFIFGIVGLHRLYLGRTNIIIGIFYLPLSVLTFLLLPLCDLISISSLVDKANDATRDEVEDRIRAKYTMPTQGTRTTVGTILKTQTGGPKTTAVAICSVVLLLGTIGYKIGYKPNSTPNAKKNVTGSLETKIREMPQMCQRWIRRTVNNTFGSTVSKWGKHGVWRKGRYNYASYRFTFANNNHFKILCCLDRQTQKFGLWSITDLKRNQTTAYHSKGSCRS